MRLSSWRRLARSYRARPVTSLCTGAGAGRVLTSSAEVSCGRAPHIGRGERRLHQAEKEIQMSHRSNRQWALRALKNAETLAARKTDPEEQAKTLLRGIRTARSWLDGTHPKASQAG